MYLDLKVADAELSEIVEDLKKFENETKDLDIFAFCGTANSGKSTLSVAFYREDGDTYLINNRLYSQLCLDKDPIFCCKSGEVICLHEDSLEKYHLKAGKVTVFYPKLRKMIEDRKNGMSG